MYNAIKDPEWLKIKAKANGYTFSLHENIWVLNKDSSIYFTGLDDLLKGELKINFLKTLAYFAENYSGKYTMNLYYRTKEYLLFCKGKNTFSPEQIINYKYFLSDKIWYLSFVKIFFKKWYGLGYSGVTKEIVDLFDNWRIKGNIKGDLVKRKDPNEGPLTDCELSAINEKLVQAYEKNKINKRDLTISLLLSHTGRRTLQISQLKIKDLISTSNKKGETIYFINIPRIKQRNVDFRSSFKSFALHKELWELIYSLIEENLKKVESYSVFKLNDEDLKDLPLFPCWNALSEIKNEDEFKNNLLTDKYHIKTNNIRRIINNMAERCQIYSERTGELINLNPRRFRYTIGTRAAREGFGELIIAELLDHSDTQNAGIYVKNVPEHVAKLDEAVGYQLAPFAQAFAGKLVDKESDSVRGNDATSRIRSEEGKSIGNCGDHGFCGANVPIPCYTCIHFQPWVDGPHKEVYDSLLEERKRVEQITGDIAIVEILDRSILAVAEVVLKCEKRVKELSELENNVKGI
ncbi:site-specific integrase [Pectobacterium brasiliense]|uniref:site-specific integrase n=1 Tax=Pectobacterium brasiliense TaxID=180957 RepID=UPI0030190542